MRINLYRAFLCLLATSSFHAYSQTPPEPQSEAPPQSIDIPTYDAQTPVLRVDPKYPVSAAREGREGWVELSFIVNPDGDVEDILVLESNGRRDFEAEAKRAIKKWKYSPLPEGSEAYLRSLNKVRLDFILGNNGGNTGITRRFKTDYETILEATKNAEFKDAKKAINKVRNRGTHNMTESALFASAQAAYYKAIDNQPEYVRALSRSLGFSKSFKDNVVQSTRAEYFVALASQNAFSSALNTFEQLQKKHPESPYIEKLQPYVKSIEDYITSENPINRMVTILDSNAASHTLSRDQFVITERTGDIDRVELRCDRKRITILPEQENILISVPGSWGSCTVTVEGDSGSTLIVSEISTQQAADLKG